MSNEWGLQNRVSIQIGFTPCKITFDFCHCVTQWQASVAEREVVRGRFGWRLLGRDRSLFFDPLTRVTQVRYNPQNTSAPSQNRSRATAYNVYCNYHHSQHGANNLPSPLGWSLIIELFSIKTINPTSNKKQFIYQRVVGRAQWLDSIHTW